MKSKNTQEFTKYYQKNKVTDTYDLQREGTAYRREKRRLELKYFLELLDKKNKDKVLELGCSSGFLTKHLGKVTAIDTSKDMLKIAHGKNPQAKCIHADMFNLPFRNNSFNKVITMRVWNHLNEQDLRKAIKESRRVLKKNGWLIFDMEEKSVARRIASVFYKFIFKPTGYKIYQYHISEIKKILDEEGFKVAEGRALKHRVGRQIILKALLRDRD